jgi:uncharacterized protein with PIN domain
MFHGAFLRNIKRATMKFIADAMLGKLAKRMRLLGLDVLYDPGLDDNDIIHISMQQDRVILTRDTGLAARPLAANHLYVESEHVRKQLEQVLSAFPVEQLPLTRCSRCNEPVIPVAKENVQDFVPQYVYEKNDDFLQCPKCGRIYWHGTHVKRMALQKKKSRPTGTGSQRICKGSK